MRKLVILMILLAAVVITAGCSQKGPDSSGGENGKENVTANGQNNSSSSQGSQNGTVVELTQLEQINASLQKGPVLVKIGAEWCGPCQELKPILKELATEYAGRATIMSMDADNSPKLATDYFGSYDYPDSFVIVGVENNGYLYMQGDGKVGTDRFKARIIGLQDKQEFENVLNLALQKGNSKAT